MTREGHVRCWERVGVRFPRATRHLLLWDNCTVQHRAVQDYDLPQRRLMHRTTMGGSAPS
jgi:alpha-ketoglutarate-dependent taurine dioxygenase